MKWSARFFLSRTLAYGADAAEGNAAVRAMEIAVMHGGHQLPAAILLHVLPRWAAARSDREAIDCPFPSHCTFCRAGLPQDLKAATPWLHIGLLMYGVQSAGR